MEGETKGFMDIFTTFPFKSIQQIITKAYEWTALFTMNLQLNIVDANSRAYSFIRSEGCTSGAWYQINGRGSDERGRSNSNESEPEDHADHQ